MPASTKKRLLNDPAVRQEINRYKWLESEKLGADIGFEKASREWLTHCSAAWLKVHNAPGHRPGQKAQKI